MGESKRLRDGFWLWGHPAGSHDNLWEIKGNSRMTPGEGAYYLGINKSFFVCFGGKPNPPWDQEAMALDSLTEVAYSIIGDAGCEVNPETLGHLDEVLRIAEKFPNTTGAVFDDFLGFGNRQEIFTPEVLKKVRDKLHAKNLNMWLAMYERNLLEENLPYLDAFDCISVCTWRGEDLPKYEEILKKGKTLLAGKKLYMVCYLYNYGQKCEFTAKEMEYQLNLYAKLMREGVVEGSLLVSNTIGDLGLEAVEYAKAWIKEHGDELI
jgi:hypothetical protein